MESQENYAYGHLQGRESIFYKNGTLKESMEYKDGLLEGVAATYAQNGAVITEQHYINGHLVSHEEYGDKTTFTSKTGSEGSSATVSNNAPAPSDMPTKLDSGSYDNPSSY
jgi:antitoxin component YwqK of YwqJK toxin-antitoxin module